MVTVSKVWGIEPANPLNNLLFNQLDRMKYFFDVICSMYKTAELKKIYW